MIYQTRLTTLLLNSMNTSSYYTTHHVKSYIIPLQVTVPCPPNPIKAKKIAAMRKAKEEKMKNPHKVGRHFRSRDNYPPTQLRTHCQSREYFKMLQSAIET